MRKNFFIFLTKEKNFQICLKHLIYGADVSRPDQRSLGNLKRGDLAFIWVPELKQLYGIFEIHDRIYYDKTDLGWTNEWPYRCRFKLWDEYLRTIQDEQKAELMSFVSREFITLKDLTNLGGFIHSLLYDEGIKLLRFFLEKSVMLLPKEVYKDFASLPIPPRTPFNFSTLITKSRSEYVLEMYLLQNQNKIEELVGSDISEIYNMLFGYQNRYLDIMTIHRDYFGDIFKITIIELKTRISVSEMERALDELSAYMFWITDQLKKGRIKGSPDLVNGILLTPKQDDHLRPNFTKFADKYSSLYALDSKKMKYISYEIVKNNLIFNLEI